MSNGLSPLTRGTQRDETQPAGKRRFIPADAGNTASPLNFGSVFTVYPRWRGEHVIYYLRKWFLTGLSPLARGTLSKPARPGPPLRFIPAGAGNTL